VNPPSALEVSQLHVHVSPQHRRPLPQDFHQGVTRRLRTLLGGTGCFYQSRLVGR
jgi:hypothetical protein